MQHSANHNGQVQLQSGVRAVIFDLDDTLCGYWQAARTGLLNTFRFNAGHGRTPEEMLTLWGDEFGQFAKEIAQPEWYTQYCISGEATRMELMRRVLSRTGSADPALVKSLSDTYYVERHAALELFPDAAACLAALKGRTTLGMITNGPADIQTQEIEKLGIRGCFDFILIEGEMGVGKPEPVVMKRAEELAGASGPEIVMVGNSYKHDIVPAIAAGWQTVWLRRATDVAPSSKTGRPEERPDDGPVPSLEAGSLTEVVAALDGSLV